MHSNVEKDEGKQTTAYSLNEWHYLELEDRGEESLLN